MYSNKLFYLSFIFLLIPTILFAQYKPPVKGDTTERYAKIITTNTNNTMLYDSTEISKSDAFVIVNLLEKEGIWSSRIRNENAIFAITKNNVYSINLFVKARALHSSIADSVLKDILYKLKPLYPKRKYEFELMSIDSTYSLITKEVKIQ